MTTLNISELFLSIQGESSYAGQPCGFVRLATCPLRCTWCDTAYAFSPGDTQTVADIVAQVAAWEVDLVEVTGGEPLAQAGVHDLLRSLCDRGHTVLLETSGALPIDAVDPRVTIIMDLKCPGSGECASTHWANLPALKPRDEVKFVIRDHADFGWAADVVRRETSLLDHTLHFSPVHDELDAGDLARWILEAALPVRLQVQLHKYLWPGVERGV